MSAERGGERNEGGKAAARERDNSEASSRLNDNQTLKVTTTSDNRNCVRTEIAAYHCHTVVSGGRWRGGRGGSLPGNK